MTQHMAPEELLKAKGALAEHYAPGGEVPRQEPLSTFRAADLADTITPTRRFLDDAGMLPWRHVTMLSGDGGTGKSLLALQLAAAVAAGGKWLDIGVNKGPALYVSAEDDLDEVHIRLEAICAAEEVQLSSLTDLAICDLAGADAVLATEAGSADRLVEQPLFERLRVTARQLRPNLIVLDNLADMFAGNENVRPLARQFVGLLRRLAIEIDCVVLLLAHPSLSGINSGSGSSGSTAWHNSVRSRLYLTTSSTSDDPDARKLSNKKANYGPTGYDLALRWDSGRFVRIKSDAGDPTSGAARASKAERVFLTLLQWHEQRGIHLSPSPSPSFAPSVFADHPENEGVTKPEFYRAQTALLGIGRVKVETFGPPSRTRNRLVEG